jgi:hypothetical protein
MTVSRAHGIAFENIVSTVKKYKLDKLGFSFALVFLVPSDIANQFPKQKISGGVDDLKNSDVQQIRGIGKESAKQLKSLKIFTMHDLFVAIQDELILKKMQNFIKSAYISEFRASVEQIQKYEVLSAIPQYILAIKVEKK